MALVIPHHQLGDAKRRVGDHDGFRQFIKKITQLSEIRRLNIEREVWRSAPYRHRTLTGSPSHTRGGRDATTS
jgi:cell wall assembly regulator SMI1